MTLVHAAGRHRRDGATAILDDRRATIVRAEAGVQSRAQSGRDTAAPAEEAVRQAGERRGADHFDTHRPSLITGS